MQRVIFMGTPDFSVEVLQGLIDEKYDIVAVVTQPDRPVGRKRVLTPPPVKEVALENEIKVYQPERLSKSEDLDELIALEADFIITAAYGQFLPTKFLNSARIAAVNVHASLLPKYRGAAPIQYAIWQGEEETGVTIMHMVKEMDAGDIISQKSIPISDDDNSGMLFEKLAVVGKELLLETLPKLANNTADRSKQNPAKVTFAPMLTRAQEQLDWTQTAKEIDQHVRAFTPSPSTYTYLNNQRVKVWKGRVYNEKSSLTGKAGEIVDVTDNSLLVYCDNSIYEILEWQESGKRRMSIDQYLNGVNKEDIVGSVFEYIEPKGK